MPEKSKKKGFDILDVVEEIRQGKMTVRSEKVEVISVPNILIDQLNLQSHTEITGHFAYDIWRELLHKTQQIPKSEFRDEISELRQEVYTNKLLIQSLTKTVEELSKEVWQKQTNKRISLQNNKLLKNYIEILRKIDIIKQIYIVEINNGFVCWTIIESEPFNISACEPIYNAQVKIFQEKKGDSILDFHVLNLLELNKKQELKDILPPNANLIWQK